MKISGKKIRDLRESKKISRAALSRKSGIPLRTLESWELGERSPRDFDKIEALARALGLPIEALLDDQYLSLMNAQALADAETYAEYSEIEIEFEQRLFQAIDTIGIERLFNRFIERLGIVESLKLVEEVMLNEGSEG